MSDFYFSSFFVKIVIPLYLGEIGSRTPADSTDAQAPYRKNGIIFAFYLHIYFISRLLVIPNTV